MKNSFSEHSVILIGGNLIAGTIEKRGLLKGIDLVGTLTGASPYALASKRRFMSGVKCGRDTADSRRVDFEDDLQGFLSRTPAKKVAVDLHYVCQPLVEYKNNYYTKYPDVSLSAYGKGAREVSPASLSPAKRRSLMEGFADALLAHFKGEDIALIKTHKSAYFVVGSRVREQECDSFNRTMAECEAIFIEKTGCNVINTLDFYFMEKKAGGMQYESEAYADTADNVKRFVREQHIRRRPIFRYSMDRYCRYYENIYKKAFGSFLRVSWAIENLVYSAPVAFVRENYELLREAEKLLLPSYTEAAEKLRLQNPDSGELCDILIAFDALINKNFTDPNVRYELIFKNKLVVRELWKHLGRYAAENWTDVFPEQVTEANYGYWFARMLEETSDDERILATARTVREAVTGDPSVTVKPITIDLLGSCVSRLNFQYNYVSGKSDMVYRGDMFQALPVFMNTSPVKYDDKYFPPKTSHDNLVVKYQLDGTVTGHLDGTGTDWLMLDFYTLTARSVYRLSGKYFCDNKNFAAKKLGAASVQLHKTVPLEEMKAELDRLAEYVRKRYGSRVILVKHKRMTHYIDHLDKLHRFSESEIAENLARNEYSDACADYFSEISGCYYVDTVDNYISDEMNLLYLNSIHYENEFYEELEDIIRHIVKEEPEKRVFSASDPAVRVKRIARLTAVDNSPELIAEALSASPLDKCIISLPSEAALANATLLGSLYGEYECAPEGAAAALRTMGQEDLANALSDTLTI